MFKAITVNTPAEAPLHINAEDDAALYDGIIGTSAIIGEVPIEVVDSNTITLGPGLIVANGRYCRIIGNEVVNIRAGISGQQRTDLIVIRTESADGIDNMSLLLIEGTGTAGQTAELPATQDNDVVLFRINVNGFAVNPVRCVPVIQSIHHITQKMGNVTRITRGSVIVSIQAGATSVAFLDNVIGTPTIVATNGDGVANRTHIEGVTIQNGKAYAVFGNDIQLGSIRINYTTIE